jgi:hypothetical protein
LWVFRWRHVHVALPREGLHELHERGKGWSGIHHIGFQVESLDAITERLRAA